MQAYVGDKIAYQQRGRALATTELSWAGSFLLGVPLIGFIMEKQGWQAPYAWIAALGLIAAFGLWRIIPAGDGRTGKMTSLRSTWQVIRNNRVVWASALYVFLVMAANELLLIVYGDMMELKFSLSLSSLGLATAVIGGAEISGELTTALFVDRLGKRPFVFIAGLITCLMYLAIPFSSTTLATALVSLFILFLFFEMSVVGGVPLMTELVPSARSVVMSVVLATGGLGRGVGALLGPAITQIGGFELLGVVAAVTMLIALSILFLWIREGTGELS
jgi:predicted MFS family arabinose efflux permease